MLGVKPTSRLRVLDYLRKHQTASAMELSRALGMTRANARHHLVVLEENDLVQVIGSRKEGRGRPANLYALSRHVLGDGLDELSHLLLDEWMANLSEVKKDAALRTLARRLAKQASGPLTARLAETVKHLGQLYYQARWEAGATGARVILGHCPYAAIINDHPELCRMDAFLLEESLGLLAEQTAKLERPGQGMPQCVFFMTRERI
jgi:predicted ArsR family transcriptional regulator